MIQWEIVKQDKLAATVFWPNIWWNKINATIQMEPVESCLCSYRIIYHLRYSGNNLETTIAGHKLPLLLDKLQKY